MREQLGCAARLGVVAQVKVVTDQAAAYLQVLEQVLSRAWSEQSVCGVTNTPVHPLAEQSCGRIDFVSLYAACTGVVGANQQQGCTHRRVVSPGCEA